MPWEFLVLILLVVVIYLIVKNIEWKIKFNQKLKEWVEKNEKTIREDAIKRSARTLSGKILEKLIPFLEDFPYDPHDIRWLGDPVDLIIFDGYSMNKRGEGNLEQVVFCEVKSGESQLTKTEKEIKDLVEKKKVKWEEFRVS